jgi:hypothetical protein
VNDPTLYAAALASLARFTSGSYYGRLVQIYLACKHYGRLIPRVGDAVGTDIAALQRLFDELYEKPSRRPGPSIAILFNDNHLYRTGERPPGKGPSNIWRNNFNMQKGVGCFATAAEIVDPAFRNRRRAMCPHLVSASGNLEGATCDLDPRAAQYRREDHPKVFRIDPVTRDHFVYDPSDINYYLRFVLAPGGRRLPIAPLIVALYYDSPLAAGRTEVDINDFLLDFDYVGAEYTSYFDDDPALPEHAALRAAFPGMLSWTRVVVPAAPPTLPAIPVPVPGRRRKVPSPAIVSTPLAPPAGGYWWDAEQAVRQMLEADGWKVIDKSRFGLGYDLLASKAGTVRYVEVKSSAGQCNPIMTDNEYLEARRLRHEYVLAVVENFDPKKPVVVLWVHDPAQLSFTARNVKVFSLPRSQWVPRSNSSIP